MRKKEIFNYSKEKLVQSQRDIQYLTPEGFVLSRSTIESRPAPIRHLFVKNFLNQKEKESEFGWLTNPIEIKDADNALEQLAKEIQKTELTIENSKNIDMLAESLFPNTVLNQVFDSLSGNKSIQEKLPFVKTMIYQGWYYEAAVHLGAMIDSICIRQNTQDCEEQENQGIPSNPEANGWKSFIRIIDWHFNHSVFMKHILNYKIVAQSDMRSEIDKLDKYLNYENDIVENLNLISLIYSAMWFFERFSWGEYKETIPQVPNRNWLAHGLYTRDEITYADCLKLLLLLVNINKVFAVINRKD